MNVLNGNKAIFLFFFLFPCYSLFAQEPVQTVRGQVVDALSQQVLGGATVQLLGAEPFAGTVTGPQGEFRMERVKVGRYRLQVSYVGYQTLILPELLLESGKELVLRISLEESDNELETVEVNASREGLSVNAISSYTMTVEETLRFPATFYDPARLAMAFPGVQGVNDQANHISIRGNSPNSLAWQLEGIDIVNPNHLSNGGTVNDRPTRNGGGVNILSAQLLGTSTLLTGAFPAGYGNALAGVMDMRLRKGNSEQQEFTSQIGLIGIDLAAEGPLLRGGKASYLVNYRYSTLGLLSNLGVDLGDEAINFQDLAFTINFPTKGAGQLTLFGMGGRSENVFEGQRDTAAWEFDKDRQDIVYDSRMGALGLSYLRPLGQSGLWRLSMGYSAKEASRTAEQLDSTLALNPLDASKLIESKLSIRNTFTQKVGQRSTLLFGALINREQYDLNFQRTLAQISEIRTLEGAEPNWILQPYLNWNLALSDKWQLKAGLHFTYHSLNEEQSLEPRVVLSWEPTKKQQISLAYSIHSQQQRPEVLASQLLGLTRSQHFGLAYELRPNANNHVKLEWYYQRLSDVPVSDVSNDRYSEINTLDDIRLLTTNLVNEGTGDNFGMEVSWQHYLNKDYYFMINGSLFESTYEGSNTSERNTRFNTNYIANITAGKEWAWNKGSKKRLLGLNARVNWSGGLRQRVIDEEASADLGFTVYDQDNYFRFRQEDFFRVDLRIYYKNNKDGYSSTLALDIQNATNAENVAYRYYDLQQQQVVTEFQLGLIPILSYRTEF
ncbi:MAG: TonB-dependent receptor [Bacteroidota bacterium]